MKNKKQIDPFSGLPLEEVRKRIEQGLKDIEEGKVKPWEDVKRELLKRIKAVGK